MNASTIKKQKKVAACAVIAGILLYLSKFLRNSFTGNDGVLFILGILPNFGFAFAIPFIYVSHRLRLHKPVKYFVIACLVTLLLMVANEVRDRYQTGRVFDWKDIYASLAGVVVAWFVFHLTIRKITSKPAPISQ